MAFVVIRSVHYNGIGVGSLSLSALRNSGVMPRVSLFGVTVDSRELSDLVMTRRRRPRAGGIAVYFKLATCSVL